MKAENVRIGMKVRTIELHSNDASHHCREGVFGVVTGGPMPGSCGEGWLVLHETKDGRAWHVPYWFDEFVEVGSPEEVAYFLRRADKQTVLDKLSSYEKVLLGL